MSAHDEDKDKKIVAIVGCGAMGEALARGLNGSCSLRLYDKHRDKAEAVAAATAAATFSSITEAIDGNGNTMTIIVAVKPQSFHALTGELAPIVKVEDHTIVSVMSGVRLLALKEAFGECHVARAMPNLACAYKQGVVALAAGKELSESRKNALEALFKPLGLALWIDESKINAITSLTGSGPAFILVIVEAVVDAAIKMGIPAAEALPMACQLLRSSAALLQGSGAHPAAIKWKVSSPDGTTIAGIKALEQHNVRYGIIATFLAAYDRAANMEE